jgi:hypothetical protein
LVSLLRSGNLATFPADFFEVSLHVIQHIGVFGLLRQQRFVACL